MAKKHSKSNQSNTASVKDGHLILSLPQSNSPILWRKDLGEIGSATFAIKKEKEEFFLILKKQKGTSEKISSFDDNNTALDVLNIASQALLNGEAPIAKRQISNENVQNKKGFPKWAIILLIIFGLIALYIYAAAQMPNRITMSDAAPQNLNSTTSSSSTPQTGVPMSADDFLNGM